MSTPKKTTVYGNCYYILSHIMTGQLFTVRTIANLIESNTSTAATHINAMSLHFPIIEVEDERHYNKLGRKPTVYQYVKEVIE